MVKNNQCPPNKIAITHARRAADAKELDFCDKIRAKNNNTTTFIRKPVGLKKVFVLFLRDKRSQKRKL